MNEALANLEAAVRELRAAVWAALEPPVARAARWLACALDRGRRRPW